MNGVGQPERATQNRVIALFRDELGYRYSSDMDTEIIALEAKLAKARQLKQGMMQKLLTGKGAGSYDDMRERWLCNIVSWYFHENILLFVKKYPSM